MNEYLQLSATLGTEVSAQIPSLRLTQNKLQPIQMQTKLPHMLRAAAEKPPCCSPDSLPSPGGSLYVSKNVHMMECLIKCCFITSGETLHSGSMSTVAFYKPCQFCITRHLYAFQTVAAVANMHLLILQNQHHTWEVTWWHQEPSEKCAGTRAQCTIEICICIEDKPFKIPKGLAPETVATLETL